MSKTSTREVKACSPSAPYGWMRPSFKSGDLIAQSHGDWKSWQGIQVIGVRAFTLSTYSHVGVIEVDETDGRVYLIEAVVPEIRRIPLSQAGSFYHLPLPVVWTPETTEFAHAQIGKPYSKWDAIRAYFGPLPEGTVSECAALTREILLRASVDLGRISRPDTVVQRALELHSSVTFVENATSSCAYMADPRNSR